MFLLVNGFYEPYYTFYVALANVIFRPIYSWMYLGGGPNNRLISVVAGLLPIYALTIYTAYN